VERGDRVAEADAIAVVEGVGPGDPSLVDERPVARHAVVDHDPSVRRMFEARVCPRDLAVPGDGDVGRRQAADGGGRVVGLELEHLLASVFSVEHEERVCRHGAHYLWGRARRRARSNVLVRMQVRR
jgi:hypothetical protein